MIKARFFEIIHAKCMESAEWINLCELLWLGVGFHGKWMVADDALNYCEASAVVLRMMRSTTANGLQEYCNWFALLRETTACFARDESAYAKNWVFRGDFFSGRPFLLSLLSPVLSLNLALQLTDIQLVTEFSDSSDSKNRKTFLTHARHFNVPLFSRANGRWTK